MTRKFSPRCSVGRTVHVIGGKWKAVILFYLIEHGTLRFGELRHLVGEITQRMLTLQLREMEAAGLVKRKVYPVVPPHVEYSLTDRGRSLEPVITAMRTWGRDHQACAEPINEAGQGKPA